MIVWTFDNKTSELHTITDKKATASLETHVLLMYKVELLEDEMNFTIKEANSVDFRHKQELRAHEHGVYCQIKAK